MNVRHSQSWSDDSEGKVTARLSELALANKSSRNGILFSQKLGTSSDPAAKVKLCDNVVASEGTR